MLWASIYSTRDVAASRSWLLLQLSSPTNVGYPWLSPVGTWVKPRHSGRSGFRCKRTEGSCCSYLESQMYLMQPFTTKSLVEKLTRPSVKRRAAGQGGWERCQGGCQLTKWQIWSWQPGQGESGCGPKVWCPEIWPETDTPGPAGPVDAAGWVPVMGSATVAPRNGGTVTSLNGEVGVNVKVPHAGYLELPSRGKWGGKLLRWEVLWNYGSTGATGPRAKRTHFAWQIYSQKRLVFNLWAGDIAEPFWADGVWMPILL